jgi:hypothetical protein
MDLKELEAIASREMTKNGLHGWTFSLAAAKRQLGVCKYGKKRIEIAEYYALNSPQDSARWDCLLPGSSSHRMDRTTPPSTRSAAPFVAEARGLQT